MWVVSIIVIYTISILLMNWSKLVHCVHTVSYFLTLQIPSRFYDVAYRGGWLPNILGEASEATLRYLYIRFVGAILDFQLPVRSHSISSSLIGLLDPENIGIDIRILLLSCLQVEINEFPDWRPPSWISDFRLGRTVFPIVLTGKGGAGLWRH